MVVLDFLDLKHKYILNVKQKYVKYFLTLIKKNFSSSFRCYKIETENSVANVNYFFLFNFKTKNILL